jgi:hypothetical protein
MNSEAKSFLKGNYQVQLERDPHIIVKDMKKRLLSDQQNYDLTDIKKSTLLKDRAQEQGTVEEHQQECVEGNQTITCAQIGFPPSLTGYIFNIYSKVDIFALSHFSY